jgi:Lytic transglycolase
MLDKGAWPYWSVAAFSPSNKFYKAGPLGACGQCYEIKCVDKDGPWKGRCFTGSNQVSVVVQITDSCPECEADHIDIQALTFAKVCWMR